MTSKPAEAPADLLVGLADIATMLGLSPASVRTYHTDANRRRRQNASLPQDMPAPDVIIGRTPAWKIETITEWKREREESARRNLERLRAPRKTAEQKQ